MLTVFFFISCVGTYFAHEKLFDTSKMDQKDLGEVHGGVKIGDEEFEAWR